MKNPEKREHIWGWVVIHMMWHKRVDFLCFTCWQMEIYDRSGQWKLVEFWAKWFSSHKTRTDVCVFLCFWQKLLLVKASLSLRNFYRCRLGYLPRFCSVLLKIIALSELFIILLIYVFVFVVVGHGHWCSKNCFNVAGELSEFVVAKSKSNSGILESRFECISIPV